MNNTTYFSDITRVEATTQPTLNQQRHSQQSLLRMKAFLSFLLALVISSAAMASSSSPLAPSYRLERLIMRSDSYIYEGDKDHAYMATTAVSDTSSECSAAGAVPVDLALHIANRFRVTLCLAPPQGDDDNNNNDNNNINIHSSSYQVQVVGPMMSTRMMPVDEEVQQLEQRWSLALPAVTRASVDDAEYGFLRLTDEDASIEIVFRQSSGDGEDVTDEGEE